MSSQSAVIKVLLSLALLAAFGAVANAALVTYTIDPARSSFTLSGNVNLYELNEQEPGSLTDAVAGSLVADLQGEWLVFSGESNIDFVPHPAGPFQPRPDEVNSPGVEDNFGAMGGRLFGFEAAVRDARVSILSGAASFGGSVNDLELKLIDGRLDVDASAFDEQGSFDLATEFDASLNQAEALLTRAIEGDLETITLPVRIERTFSVALPNDSTLLFTGLIVAQRTLVMLPGDANGDGHVDLADFLILKNNFGSGSTRSEGDFTGDGTVDFADFLVLKQGFGSTAAAVPEPGAAVLLLFGIALLGLRSIARSDKPT